MRRGMVEGSVDRTKLHGLSGSLTVLFDDKLIPDRAKAIARGRRFFVEVQVVTDREEPFTFHLVEKLDIETANFGPRTIDEGVVIKELAADNQGDGEDLVDVVFVELWNGHAAESRDPLRHVEETQEQRRRWKPSRGQNLQNPLAVARARKGKVQILARQPLGDQIMACVGDEVGHHVEVIVEAS